MSNRMVSYKSWMADRKIVDNNARLAEEIPAKIKDVLEEHGYKNVRVDDVFEIWSDYPDMQIDIRSINGKYVLIHYKECLDREEDGFGEDKIEEKTIRIDESDIVESGGKDIATKWANTVLMVVNILLGKNERS